MCKDYPFGKKQLTVLLFVLPLTVMAEDCADKTAANTGLPPSFDALPQLNSERMTDQFSVRLAQLIKEMGLAHQNEQSTLSMQAKRHAFNYLRDALITPLEEQGEALLSSYGNASLALEPDAQGKLNGSYVRLFSPWWDRDNRLLFTDAGVTQMQNGLHASIGIGQRYRTADWLVGYNAFIDRHLNSGLQRASLGAEAWTDYLRFCANYYHPLTDWHNDSKMQQQRFARGYDITAAGWLPFYRHFGLALTWEQYVGEKVDLFNTGNGYRNPQAVEIAVNYTPVPLLSFTATHKTGEGGLSQEMFGLNIHYRPGVALKKQLSSEEVAQARSLRGSRYDNVTRHQRPVSAFRLRKQQKTLSVFLATPPWRLQAGETLPLKLQIRSPGPVTHLSWQGDTKALSLTPPQNSGSTQGWTVIMPPWDDRAGASNQYHLSVTLENSRHQRATSNQITLQVEKPASLLGNEKVSLPSFLMP